MSMTYLMKLLHISLFLLSVDRGLMLLSVGSDVDEGRCEGLPNCVCMKILHFTSNKTKLVCENEINVDASSAVYAHPFRVSTIFKVFCDPDIQPKRLIKNYYNLLDLKIFYPEFHIMSVVSCPEPPIPYWSFIFSSKFLEQAENQFPTLNSLIVNCSDYRRKFSLQRKHLYGLKSLKELTIHCQTMANLPDDLFFDTTPSLIKIAIESTQVSSLYPNTFSALFGLQELSMRKNSIRSISNGVLNNLTSLYKLDLSHNYISDIHNDMFQDLRNLKHLNLSHNNIISLPRSISSLLNLTLLDVSYNSLEEISSIEGLHKLQRLYAGFNRLIYINTSAIASLESIERIFLSGNAVLRLDPIQFPLNKLYSLVFSHNSQTALRVDPFLSGDRIDELVFSNSSIVFIHPAFLEKIPLIRILDFSKNKLSSIPEDLLAKSKRLYKVFLGENNISELLPDTFSNNPELENLDISSNRLSSLHDKIFANNHELRYLDISNNQITTLSNILFYNKSFLAKLNAADNRLTFIDPALLSKSRQISWLDFSGNLLEQISEDIFFPLLERLFHLNLARNCISSLPLLQLPDVKYLNLSNNCLEYIQEGLFQNLTSLDTLDLSYNHIKNISNSTLLPQNVHMTLLDLSNNQLSYIPREILNKKDISIDTINFSSNAMSHFYADRVVNVKGLVELHVANNNLSYFGIEPDVENWELFASIKLLDLSNNSLDFKEAKWFYDDLKKIWGKTTFLLWFPNLEVLLLSNNSISTIFLECRDDLTKLRLLDLRYNKICHLQYHDVMFTLPNAPRLIPVTAVIEKRNLHPRLNITDLLPAPPPPLILDLRGNLIRSVDIPPNKVKKIFLDRNGTIPEGIYGHATILLDDNPVSCDCSMLNFMRIVQNDVAPISFIHYSTGRDWIMPARIELGNLSCWEPKSIRGSLISEPETWIHHILPLISLCSL